ncbi:RimK family alpha-L-glutamate ligase [Candidatus Woesearchaeota archaeon]|nr:RimK family alpha-L-glutamate ligase [Candidatus Woesearchaeota archaeon]
MKAAVISMGSVSSQWIVDKLKAYFDVVDDFKIKDFEVQLTGKELSILYKGKEFGSYDCIYAKGSFRYSNVLRSITNASNKNVYMPIKEDAFGIGHNKILTYLALQQNKIPIPKTYIAASVSAAKKILKDIKYPVIMKLPSGTHGVGVMISDSYESASSMIDTLIALKQPFLIQEYIETGGSDVRAFVVGDKVIASMKRQAASGEKRSNIHAGGSAKPIELSEKTKAIAIKAAKVLGCDICGVDLLETPSGPKVLEVNLSPGLQGITKATEIDIPEKIAKFLYEKTKEMKSKKVSEEQESMMKELTEEEQELVTQIEYRGERILLPTVVSKISKFDENDDVVIKSSKGNITIKKY